MPVGVGNVFCVEDTALGAWTAGTPQQPAQGQVQAVMQLVAGSQCPQGSTAVTVQPGGAGTSFLVAYDTRMPSHEEMSMFFVIGFAMAFGGARMLSYGLGQIILLVKRTV